MPAPTLATCAGQGSGDIAEQTTSEGEGADPVGAKKRKRTARNRRRVVESVESTPKNTPESTPEPDTSTPGCTPSATPPATPGPASQPFSYASTPEMPGNVGEELLAELQAMGAQERRRRIAELKAMGGYCRQIESNKARNRALETMLGLKWAVKSLFGPTEEGGPDRDPAVPKKRRLNPASPSPSGRVTRRSARISTAGSMGLQVEVEGGQTQGEGGEAEGDDGSGLSTKSIEDATDEEEEEAGKENEQEFCIPPWAEELRTQLLSSIVDGADELPAVESEDWEYAVDLLFQLEELYGFENPKRGLPTAGRPPAIPWWSGRGRPNRLPKSPQIKSIRDFGTEVMAYWERISPEWRERNGQGGMNRTGSGSWLKLRFPGQNGLLSVLACLRWWYMHEGLAGGSLLFHHIIGNKTIFGKNCYTASNEKSLYR